MSLGKTDEEVIRRAAELVTFMLAGYPVQRSKMTEADVRAMIAFYAAGLCDLDYDQVKRAMTRLGRSSEFIPPVAAIRAACVVTQHGARKTGVEAWGAVDKAMSQMGAYRTHGVDFRFSDPITTRVVRSLGWEDMCVALPDHIRSRFITAYDEIARQERTEAQVAAGARSPMLEDKRFDRRLEASPQPRLDRDGGHARTLGELVASHTEPEEA